MLAPTSQRNQSHRQWIVPAEQAGWTFTMATHRSTNGYGEYRTNRASRSSRSSHASSRRRDAPPSLLGRWGKDRGCLYTHWSKNHAQRPSGWRERLDGSPREVGRSIRKADQTLVELALSSNERFSTRIGSWAPMLKWWLVWSKVSATRSRLCSTTADHARFEADERAFLGERECSMLVFLNAGVGLQTNGSRQGLGVVRSY